MKNLYKHIITGFMLTLVLFYSAPVKSLHDCKNLHHHSEEAVLSAYHMDCPICDLEYAPFIVVSNSPVTGIPVYSLEIYTPLRGIYNHVYCNTYLNKGPPALV